MEDTIKPRLHNDFSYRVYTAGQEKTPLLVIDNFVQEPELLIDFCCENSAFTGVDNFYPGLRMGSPRLYLHAIHFYLGKLFEHTFGLNPENWQGGRSVYSMVVTPKSQLQPRQCIPHIDSFLSGDLACVHFLCSENKGGTSLYRHKKTGFEIINQQRVEEYNQCVTLERELLPLQQSYICGSNELFEQITCIDAKFNRMIVYPGNILHSANIAEDFDFDQNPRTGRLTLNSFIFSKRD